jgi:hypothetical protein
LTFWSGSLNTRYWLDRARRQAGVYFSQVEPFPYRDLMNDVMRSALPPPSPADVDPHGVVATAAQHDGRDALRLVEADDTRASGFALLKGVTLRDGRIDVDVAGRRGPYAKEDDRGFVGVAFRVAADAAQYEVMYIRPDNGRADDQLQRNHSTQYVSHPDFPWPRLRRESPGRYESYVDLESGAWTRLTIDIEGSRARLFVHGAAQPALIVNDLKLPPREGGVGLWIGAGSEAFFSNLRVTRR